MKASPVSMGLSTLSISPHRHITISPFPLSLFFILLIFPLALLATSPLQLKTNNLAIYAEQPLSVNLQSTMQDLDTRIDGLQMKLGVYVDGRAAIFFIPDHKTYQALAVGKAKIVEFSDAFYSGADHRIYIRPQGELGEGYQKILLHEYMHWYLENIFDSAPLWFHEGMATHFSGQMGFERYVYFLQQSFIGRSSDLFRLSSNYPQQRQDWQLFYLSSSMAVRYMSDKQSEKWKLFWDMVSFYHRHGKKAVFSECFIQSYNTSLYDFHREFAAYTRRLRFQYLFWGFNALLAMLLPLVLILGFHKRRKHLKTLPEPEPVPATNNWVSNYSALPPQTQTLGVNLRRKVLILCTGNSCRSIMAEALINHYLGDSWEAFSAGVNPSQVNPRAIAVMKEAGIDISAARSKSVAEFLSRNDLDLVITVCDHAKESCPVFLRPVPQVHIGISDPAPWSNEPDETALPMFRETLTQITELILPYLQNI